MHADNTKVIMELAAKKKAASFAFALDGLARETVDEEWLDTADAVVAHFGAVRDVPIDASGHGLWSALEGFARRAGVARYLDWATKSDWKEPHLAVWVSSVPVDLVVLEVDAVAPLLDALFLRRAASSGAFGWCSAVIRTLGDAAPPAVALPMLRTIGTASHEAARAILAESEARELTNRSALLGHVGDRVLDRHADEDAVVIGLFRLLASTGDTTHIERIGPFVEDAGAWMRISRAVFTAERLQGLFAAFERTGLRYTVELHPDVQLEGSVSARSLAADPRFHGGIARLAGARSTLFTLGRLFTDKAVLASLRYLVGDHDAPVRSAAVAALTQLGHPLALPFLETALMDRNRDVRTEAQTAFRAAVGDEAYAATVDRLQKDVGRVRDELKESNNWAQHALGSVQGTFAGALDATKQAPGAMKDAASRLFGRKDRE